MPLNITSITPNHFGDGAQFVIAGTGFGTSQGTVKIGGVTQSVVSWSDTAITCTAVRGSQNMGAAVLEVTAAGGGGSLEWTAPSGLADGSVITITTDGTYNFGSVGPTLLYYNDYSTATLGAPAPLTPMLGNATVTANVGGAPYVDPCAGMPYGRGLAIATEGPDDNDTDYRQLKVVAPSRYTEFFESYYHCYPQANQDNAQPYLNATSTWQVKALWHFYSSDGYSAAEDSDLFAGVQFFSNGSETYTSGRDIGSNSAPTSTFTPGPAGLRGPTASKYLRTNPLLRQLWVRCSPTLGAQPAGSDGMYRVLDSVDGVTREVDYAEAGYWDQDAATAAQSGFDRCHIPGFVRGYKYAQQAHLFFGQIYQAVGPGSPARVEIGDSATYATAKKLSICTIDSWSSTSITAKIRTGVFHATGVSGLWFYIHDANNNLVATGRLGGGTAALSWIAPAGLADGNTLTLQTDGTYSFGTKPYGAKPAYFFDWRTNATLNASASLSRNAYTNWLGSIALQTGETYNGGASSAKYTVDGNSVVQGPPHGAPYPDVRHVGNFYVYKVWKSNFTGADAYTNGGNTWNVKWTRLYSSPDGNQTTPYLGTSGGQHSQHLNYRIGFDTVAGSNTTYLSALGQPSTEQAMYSTAWRTEEVAAKSSSANDVADAECHVYFEGRKYSMTGKVSHVAAYPQETYPWGYVSLMREQDLADAGANWGFFFDCWYIDDSWCRVMISDEATWSDALGAAHTRFIQIPTAWSNNEITVVLREGGMGGFAGKYIYIIKADGTPVTTAGLAL